MSNRQDPARIGPNSKNMTVLQITVGKDHPVLRQKAAPVPQITKKTKKLIRDLADTLAQEKYGVGISAPQVGVSQQVFIATINPGKNDERLEAFINPEIIEYSEATNVDEEGCLSLPNQFGKVRRSDQITVTYFDHKGREKTATFKKFNARLIQHEYDHLQGILFIDKLVK